MKELKEYIKESIFDVDDKIENFDLEVNKEDIRKVLLKCMTLVDNKACIREIKGLVKRYKLDKYKSMGWKPGRKLIGIMNNGGGFFLGMPELERLTYEYNLGYIDWWQENITEFVGTNPNQCKLYQLRDENEFVWDVMVEFIKKHRD